MANAQIVRSKTTNPHKEQSLAVARQSERGGFYLGVGMTEQGHRFYELTDVIQHCKCLLRLKAYLKDSLRVEIESLLKSSQDARELICEELHGVMR